jgi:hypothetical protein
MPLSTTRPIARSRLTAADRSAIDRINRQSASAALRSFAPRPAQRAGLGLFRDRAELRNWLACLAIAALSGFALAAELGWLDSVLR